ncbi:MAG: precorrin-3B C(17)-methyltransferase [Paracoccaceae bacterium]|nr:precorrin-3B C(17)-methyltransferase [Paracoccaceae bacterium]
MAVTPVVVCLTASGEATARSVAESLTCPVHGRRGRVHHSDAVFDETTEHLRTLFLSGTPIVGVCAAGILVRALASVLGTKAEDPPVVAVAEDGSAAIPLLGGHRGANRLARRIAGDLGGLAAVTTAGDLALGVALDEPPPGWRLANPRDAGPVMAELLAGSGVNIEGENLFGLDPEPGSRVKLVATERPDPEGPGSARLIYHPRRHVLGVGCSRGCNPEELAGLAQRVLADADVAGGAVACVASLDLKADEPAVFDLADGLEVPLALFTAAELEVESPRLVNPSEVVFRKVGCHGVAEAAALASVGPSGQLVVAKARTAHATCALARADRPILQPRGRRRGSLAIVGVGPGAAAWRTPDASRLIADADEIVGYDAYIDLLGPLAVGRTRTGFPLGAEEDRCRHALEQAATGRHVVLVSSGDAGIYAMASLVFELLDRAKRGEPGHGLSDAARRIDIRCSPGVSAMQAAAAAAGAPLGHDFCAVSLSDLMTPRTAILRRIRAAAEGDFVIAFYNPVSQRRRSLLNQARDILLEHRSPMTPVVVGRSLGRSGESLRHLDLADLNADDADMQAVVVVGSSRSRRLELGGRQWMYTPRGYGDRLAGVRAGSRPEPEPGPGDWE